MLTDRRDLQRLNFIERKVSFVSIIIPVYNSEEWLDRALESCLVQWEFIKEIIVVDDFSTDSSWSVLQRQEKITRV